MREKIFIPTRAKVAFIITACVVLLLSNINPTLAQNADFDYIKEDGGVTITRWKGKSENVVIPDTIDGLPVMKIGNNVFNLFEINMNIAKDLRRNVTSVILPNSITEIGTKAFGSCNITEITLPESLKIIGRGAFYRCTLLKKITIPDGVEDIGDNTFNGSQLTEIILPNSVLRIGTEAFRENRIKDLVLPKHLTNIERAAFDMNPLQTITIPGNVITAPKSFSKAFATWYSNTGSQSGVYTFVNGRWTLEGKNLSYGIITAVNGAYISAVNEDDKTDKYTLYDRTYLLAPGTYDIDVRYELDGRTSLAPVKKKITIESGKDYFLTAINNDGRLQYSFQED